MKKTVYVSLFVIFLCMFFIFFVFHSVNVINIECSTSMICDRVSQVLAIIFGFVTAGIFSIITGGSLNVMLRESGAADGLMKKEMLELNILNLENRYDRLSSAMKETMKQYREKKINSDMLDRLVRKYKIEMAQIKNKIKEEKNKLKKI